MLKKIVVSSFAALAVALSGAVFADEGPDAPKEVKDPVSDPAKQMKTEAMLKDEEKALTGDQGGEMSSKAKAPVPDPEAQAKTEKMLEEEKEALQGR
jgi:hypothetical protein